LAQELDLKVGDELKYVLPLPPSQGGSTVEVFKVKGTFQTGMHGFDAKYAFIPLVTAQKISGVGNKISALKLYLKKSSQTEKIVAQLSESLPMRYNIRDWRKFNYNLFTAISQQKILIFLLLMSIILVAAFNVASSLFMLVMDKQSAISLMQALGAETKSIEKIFVTAGMGIGIVGTTVGVLLGLGLVAFLRFVPIIELPQEIYHFQYLPVEIRIFEIFLIALSSILICFLATLYPARRASKLNPIEGIRYE